MMILNFVADLVKDRAADMRVFRGTFPTRSDVPFENFVWGTENSFLVVSVDYEQSGE